MNRREFIQNSISLGAGIALLPWLAKAGKQSIAVAGGNPACLELSLDLDFKTAFAPENFPFGVAYAPYLSEGGYNYPDGIKNNLHFLEKRGISERSGEATRFWTTYEDHIKLAASLGLNAFRMGVEWSRIQPTTSSKPHNPPEWDWPAVDHYAEIIATLFRYKLEPIITLHHFTHPAWLKDDMWADDYGPALFVEYAVKVVKELNERLLKKVNRVIPTFVISNEANLWPSAVLISTSKINRVKAVRRAYDNMFWAIANVYDRLYDLYEARAWPAPYVSYNVAESCFYEQDKMFYDILRLREFGVKRRDAFKRLLEFRETYDQRIGELAQRKLNEDEYERYKSWQKVIRFIIKPEAMKKTMDYVYSSVRAKKVDYLGLDIYEPFNLARRTEEGKILNFYDYTADEEIYETFIRANHDHNETNLPIFLIENGIAYKQPIGGQAEPRRDGWTRERYFKRYMTKMINLMAEGLPIKGYLYWSLTDDYEWLSYEPRLGLYNYDYINHVIKETDGLGEPAGKVYAELIAALRSGDKKRIAKTFSLPGCEKD